MKPQIHSESSTKQFGGKPEDYIEIHNWFDSSKAFIVGSMHRAMFHHTAGIFLAEKIFGNTITNSDGKKISVRDIGEQHVLEDFRGKFIPTPQDYLQEINIQSWMNNGDGYPPSYKAFEPKKKEVAVPFQLPMIDPKDIIIDGIGTNPLSFPFTPQLPFKYPPDDFPPDDFPKDKWPIPIPTVTD